MPHSKIYTPFFFILIIVACNNQPESMLMFNDSKTLLKKESPAWSMGIRPLDSLKVGLLKKL